ncbi:glycoside hydrolase family 20 protein [Trichoderma asperellum CBS 433.97]|uniref:beta-N-acetylhexosaminidase n=1 Tax=Trichoderma asperellum (strain ATCC 204424 / CBS 433.97 / NBRC 101777) TaxID=1042311 RepID=A0A2T3ZJB6_TRIA4|nr:glycoside hydrolase family 20 protein [Trichoderma asperellum CBS 433.97]PTB44908.1 glycoside hydrolase family 20 protein [Trichoderma asperellum CBS 433.97]
MRFLLVVVGLVSLARSELLGIPTVPFNITSDKTYDLRNLHAIVVDLAHSTTRDQDGLTLIPPSLWEFAETFQGDLASIGVNAVLLPGSKAIANAIYLTLDNDKSQFVNAAGNKTSEGYRLSVTSSGITISGASPLGAWWGTRTVLQQALINDKKLKIGRGVDSPGWSERGMMQNVFHLHLSDHVWDPAKLGTHELALELYAGFRIASTDPAVAGLARPTNETYSPYVFDNLQQKCASRGVTIIPEFESPGHSIATTDWRPEIALSDFSMLNLSHPETLPTVKSYWKAAINNFHSKIVHIGADEYDSSFINEYSTFVNDMSAYIQSISGKSTRIWGTFPPSYKPGSINVNKDVTIQHWQIGQDNGLFDFIDNGYTIVNSDDYFYLDVKYSDGNVYPKELDIQRVFHGSPDGSAFAPNILDNANATNNPPRDSPNVLGHLAVVWNDWGPNASTYHEAYYMVRNGLPALADKQWGGSLQEEDYAGLFATLQPAVPDQNLDQRIPSKGPTILSYSFGSNIVSSLSGTVQDGSGNGYHGSLQNGAYVSGGALQLSGHSAYLKTPLTSKGRNYTLSFSVLPKSHGGALFSGPDSSFLNGNGTSTNLMLVSDNIAYPVNLTLPLNKWSDVKVEAIGPQTFISVGAQRQEVTILMGIWGGYMEEGPMAIEAPLAAIGKGINGQMKNIKLSSDVL